MRNHLRMGRFAAQNRRGNWTLDAPIELFPAKKVLNGRPAVSKPLASLASSASGTIEEQRKAREAFGALFKDK